MMLNWIKIEREYLIDTDQFRVTLTTDAGEFVEIAEDSDDALCAAIESAANPIAGAAQPAS